MDAEPCVDPPSNPTAQNMTQPAHQTKTTHVIRAVRTAKSITAYQLSLCGGVTLEQYAEKARQRQEATVARDQAIRDPSIPPDVRHAIQCRHVRKWGRTLFACPNCWLMPYYCICSQLERFSTKTRVVLHLHHEEWWRGSNTGCVVHQSLTGSEMLMKGHPADDERFEELWRDPQYTTAVLWPDDNAISVAELHQRADESTDGRIAIVGIDSTWKGARNLLHSYDPSLLRVKLTAGSVFAPGHASSLLAPLRQYRGRGEYPNRACTLEAVAAALRALEGDDTVADGLLSNLKLKVNALLRQKCRLAQDDMTTYAAATRGIS